MYKIRTSTWLEITTGLMVLFFSMGTYCMGGFAYSFKNPSTVSSSTTVAFEDAMFPSVFTPN